MKKEKFKRWIPLIVIIMMAGYLVTGVFIRKADLKNNGILLNATIVDYSISAKSPVIDFKYEFKYNGKSFIDYSAAGVTHIVEFIGRSFPVRFSPKSFRSEILITPLHFKRYNLKYPDSLEWVRKFAIKGI